MDNQTAISTSLQGDLDSFVSELSSSSSKCTATSYHTDLRYFLDYVASKGIKRSKSVKAQHVMTYLGMRRQLGKSDSSVTRAYMAIRGYFKFLRRLKVIDEDPTLDLKAPRNKRKAPYVPSMDEIERLIAQPDVNTEKGTRDRAMLELLYSSGLRASELCGLKLQNVYARQVLVSCGKGGKSRSVPLTDEAIHWIGQYVEQYRGGEAGPLFQTLEGRTMKQNFLRNTIIRYAAAAGLEDVTTHTLRHACATHLLDSGADLRLIQEVLGHSSIMSTQFYTQLSTHKIQAMFQHFHPRKRQEIEIMENT